jgi:2-polyprenyl-3-methyl-5-hydroxy-6-metoxy-1,4-benzoquinol methylase
MGEPAIDWVARWRALVEERHEQGRRLDQEHRRSDAWAGRARRFARHVAEGGTDDPLLRRLLGLATAETTVLDVGAGPGRHALPLARAARRVTVVEPSAAMRELLTAGIEREGLRNVEVVAAEWPPARERVEEADLVVCAHVLYPVVEVEPFLRALDGAARRGCYLVMRLGQREGPYLGLFEQIWGEPRALAPTALDLFNVAHQLGLAASFEVVPFQSWRSFDGIEDAVAQVRADVLNPPDPAAEALIRAFLAERLVERDGKLALPADAPRAGLVFWERSEGSIG